MRIKDYIMLDLKIGHFNATIEHEIFMISKDKGRSVRNLIDLISQFEIIFVLNSSHNDISVQAVLQQ